jgi:hypothetical protein
MIWIFISFIFDCRRCNLPGLVSSSMVETFKSVLLSGRPKVGLFSFSLLTSAQADGYTGIPALDTKFGNSLLLDAV